MSYYHHKIVFGNFNTVIKKVIALLKEEGFGVLTEIDIQQTLKKKLNEIYINNFINSSHGNFKLCSKSEF